LFTWFVGGLNHQIEHHLFPDISHIHYPKIAKIIKETAKEYGVNYNYHRTFGGAIVNHLRMLNRLGKA
jgi:linoleoyl-CoA desaturase